MRRLKVLAEIRKDDQEKCPFGLTIPFGCENAGKYIDNMAPLSISEDKDEQELIESQNVRFLAISLSKDDDIPQRCPYAAKILETYNAVECNYEDSAPGEGTTAAPMSSPYYNRVFTGSPLGILTYPTGEGAGYGPSMNAYYGIYSLQGSDKAKVLKVAMGICGHNTKKT
jgi:hypothetical protein